MAESRELPKDKEPVGQKPDAPRTVPPTASPGPRREAPGAKETPAPEQLVVTMSGSTGEITKIEVLEPTGHRRELSPDEYMELAGEDDADEIEEMMEAVYSAGLADALGEEEESEAELALRRLLVSRLFMRRMLQRGARRTLLRRMVRQKAVQNKRVA